jgi:RNA polymerase-binding transcription factor DksA
MRLARGQEPADRLSPDDEATRTEALFLAGALAAQQLAARQVAPGTPGLCSNCGEPCLPLAVYCDADCRNDHEARVTARARAGGG